LVERDQERRIQRLVRNNPALDLKASASGICLLTPPRSDLNRNNLASAQVLIFQYVDCRPNQTPFIACTEANTGRCARSPAISRSVAPVTKYLHTPLHLPERCSREPQTGSFLGHRAQPRRIAALQAMALQPVGIRCWVISRLPLTTDQPQKKYRIRKTTRLKMHNSTHHANSLPWTQCFRKSEPFLRAEPDQGP